MTDVHALPPALPVLILHTGDPEPGLASRHGTYGEMLRRAAGLDAAEVEVVRVWLDEAPRAPGQYRAALITGSPAMVTDREPWSEVCADWLRGAKAAGLPMFGICYGHQLLAHAFGGEVAYNPAGRELGTLPVDLTEAAADDALAATLPDRFDAQMMHAQTVLRLPPGAVSLARSALDANQLLRHAPGIYSTQFHPEFAPGFVAEHIEHYAEPYGREGLDTAALHQGVHATPQAGTLVRQFLALHAARDSAIAA
ncbi:MAG: glutamine amidotransferase [Bordetella sp.]|nr:glutamine amidotransferase [Bordetella sp.]